MLILRPAMTNFETTSPTETNYTVENSSASSSPNMLLTLKVIEYLFLAASVGTFVIIKVFPDIQVARINVLSVGII